MTERIPSPINCTFCGKHTNEVEFLISGPLVYICDECVELCGEIIAEKKSERKTYLDLLRES